MCNCQQYSKFQKKCINKCFGCSICLCQIMNQKRCIIMTEILQQVQKFCCLNCYNDFVAMQEETDQFSASEDDELYFESDFTSQC